MFTQQYTHGRYFILSFSLFLSLRRAPGEFSSHALAGRKLLLLAGELQVAKSVSL